MNVHTFIEDNPVFNCEQEVVSLGSFLEDTSFMLRLHAMRDNSSREKYRLTNAEDQATKDL
jgi:hypothetical protein